MARIDRELPLRRAIGFRTLLALSLILSPTRVFAQLGSDRTKSGIETAPTESYCSSGVTSDLDPLSVSPLVRGLMAPSFGQVDSSNTQKTDPFTRLESRLSCEKIATAALKGAISRGFAASAIVSFRGAMLEYESAHPNPTFPLLPWPPPRPSSVAILPNIFGLRPGDTYIDIDNALRLRLRRAGYISISYFSIWNSKGFAILTPLERINENASPKLGTFRFATTKDVIVQSFRDYIKRLFLGEDGRYRMALLIVSDDPFYSGSFNAEDIDVKRWEATGSPTPSRFSGRQSLTDHTEVTLLIYEFEMTKGRVRQLTENTDHALPISLHIISLGLSK